MSPTDYLVDSALVLLVIIQMKERVLTNRALLRPVVILTIAVVSYFKSFPTAGNDIPLIIAVSAIGVALGLLSGITVIMRRNADGQVTAQAGLASAATVKTHVNHVFAKIGARDRAQAVHYAYTHGLASGG